MLLQSIFIALFYFTHPIYSFSKYVSGKSNVFSDNVETQGYINLTVPQLIESFGYPVEEHFVKTLDGYILGLHRIPYGKKQNNTGKVVLLNHGLFCTSSMFVLISPDHGLGYLMADEGYDVWMINNRGNDYSRNHTTLNPNKDKKFWDFSWDEMGRFDLPATIDYILEITQVEKIFHVGHSQGTTVMYVMGATRPEYNDKIIAHASMAPVAFMTHLASPLIRIASKFTNTLAVLTSFIGKDELFANHEINKLVAELCSERAMTSPLCTEVVFLFAGFNPTEINTIYSPYFYSYYFASSSSKQLVHFGQEIQSKHFRKFDHGKIRNFLKYGTSSPPDYILSKITTKIFMFYSHYDWLASSADAEYLCNNLPNCIDKFLINNYNHVDYIAATDVPELVYKKIIGIFATL